MPGSEHQIRPPASSCVAFGLQYYNNRVPEHTFHSMVEVVRLWGKSKVPLSLCAESGALAPLARTNVVATMLSQPNTSHLMLISGEIHFQASDVVRLLSHDVDIVGGLYCRKDNHNALAWIPEMVGEQAPGGGIVEAKEIGSGFILIKRKVFLSLIQSHPELRRSNLEWSKPEMAPFLYSLFEPSVEDGDYVSGDRMFCRRWRRLGGQLFADSSVRLGRSVVSNQVTTSSNQYTRHSLWPDPIDEGARL